MEVQTLPLGRQFQTIKPMSDTTTSTDTPPPESQELAKSQGPKTIIAMGDTGIKLGTFDDLARFSRVIALSGFAPKGMNMEAIFVAIQMGLELGISPMAALQSIAVINGRPSLYGDMQLALVNASGLCEEFEEWFEDKNGRLARNPQDFTDDVCGVACVKRKGRKGQEYSFSVADARRAKLWGKAGPWSEYPQRMLRFRARAFLLRDVFGDVLKGMKSAEEMGDEPIVTVRDIVPLSPTSEFQQSQSRLGESSQTFHSSMSAPAPVAEPRPRGNKKAKIEPQETPPLPLEDPKTESELQVLQRLMGERGLTEEEMLAAAVKSKMPVGVTLAQSNPESIKLMIESIDGFLEFIEAKIRKTK